MNVRRRGSVLIIVMVVVFVVAAMVLTVARQARTQAMISTNEIAAQKADAAERGAEAYLLSLLTDNKDTLPTLTEQDFSGVTVGDSYFWIRRPDYGDSNNPAWGPLDESSKLPINTATFEQLMLVPGMTDEIANNIIAWRGATDTTATETATAADTSTASGATGGAVAVASDGIKNAPFETLDELLLVPGMTRDLLYGVPPEAGTQTQATSTGGDNWYLTHGIADYFTVWSKVQNVAADGSARLSFNDTTRLDDLITMIGDKLGNKAKADLIRSQLTPRRNQSLSRMSSLFEFAQRVNLQQDEFTLLEDYVTDNTDNSVLKGRVNLNTAPREVVLALGVLDESEVDTLLASRPAAGTSESPNSLAWAYEALRTISQNKMALLGPMVVGRGGQFSAEIVAASPNGRAFKRVRVVVDATSSPARIIYRRDLTDRGWPMEQYILDELKAGRGVNGLVATIQSGVAGSTAVKAAGAR